MGDATAYYAAKMLAEQARNVVAATISGGILTLKQRNNISLTPFSVVGPKGTKGDIGDASGTAGGDLAGSYPNPTIIKDAVAGTASMRSLGTASTQAVGNSDSRLTNARTPTGTAGGHLSGSYPSPGLLDSGWVNFTLLNGWTNFDGRTAQYRRIAGIVYLRGLIRNGTVGQPFATLPTGFRPQARVTNDHHIPIPSNAAFGYVGIDAANGNLAVASGSNVWADLSEVFFFAV